MPRSTATCLTKTKSFTKAEILIYSLLDLLNNWRLEVGGYLKAMDVMSQAILHGKMEELEVEVEGVRCCLLFTILLTLGLGLHPLNKLLPGYFIANLLFQSWILITPDMKEASNTQGFIRNNKQSLIFLIYLSHWLQSGNPVKYKPVMLYLCLLLYDKLLLNKNN